MSEFAKLHSEYQQLAGRELPEHIRRLPIDRIREAVRQARENGIVYGDLKPPAPEVDQQASLMDWDRQDMKNGNAYGGQ